MRDRKMDELNHSKFVADYGAELLHAALDAADKHLRINRPADLKYEILLEAMKRIAREEIQSYGRHVARKALTELGEAWETEDEAREAIIEQTTRECDPSGKGDGL